MSEKEHFLARWSRLKRASRSDEGVAAPAVPAAAPAASGGAAPPAEPLPPLDQLDFASDFSGFLREEVEESVKRVALKKLFHSPHFNQMDGLDVYIDDYNKFEPIPAEMLDQLEHARGLLFGEEKEQATEAKAPAEEEVEEADKLASASAETPAVDGGEERTIGKDRS